MPGRTVGPREREALEKAKRFLPGGGNGNTISQDVVIGGGKGSKVWDMSGNEYIDYALGSGPMILGHAHPEVVAAVTEQIGRGSTFFGLNENAILLAEEVVNAVPCAEKVRFTSTGTEGTFFAMRAARAFRGRDKILKFEGGFHGMNDYGLMSMAPQQLLDFPQPTPDSAGIPEALEAQVLIAPFNDLETTAAIIEKHHDELGGVIVEPLQRIVPPKPGFLEGLREATKLYGIPLIFDEVVTGFRFAYGGAQEYYGVVPDMCVLGKALAGGYPMAAVAGSEEIMAHFAPTGEHPDGNVMQEGTLNGNPVGAIAGLTTLSILKREDTYERLFATGRRLMESLRSMLFEAELPAQVVGEAPMFDVLFLEGDVTDYRSTMAHDYRTASRLNKLLFERGVYKNNKKYYLSTVHDDADIDFTTDAFKSVLEEL